MGTMNLEIVTCLSTGVPVLAKGFVVGAEPDIGIMEPYIDDFQIYSLKDGKEIALDVPDPNSEWERIINLLDKRWDKIADIENMKDWEWEQKMRKKYGDDWDAFHPH